MTDATPTRTPTAAEAAQVGAAEPTAAGPNWLQEARRKALALFARLGAALKGASEGRAAGAARARLDLGRLALFVTVPVFCWVFYTTSSGMIDIMRRETNDLTGVIGAGIGTTAILVMLASTSWSLGADVGALIARRQFLGERIVVKTSITALVFLFVFSISAFFSFTYYYNNIFRLSSRKLVGEQQPMELAAEVLLPAAKKIGENYEAESARIAATPAMRIYFDSLDALLQTASNGGQALRESLRRTHEEFQRLAAQEARKTAADLQEAQAARRQQNEAQNRIAALDQVIAQLEPIIKAKQDELAAATSTARQEDQLALDAANGLDNLGAACGQNCLAHRGKAAVAHKRAAAIRATLSGPVNERAEAIKQRDALAGQLITLRQQEENAIARSGQPAPKEEAQPDLAATVRELSEARVDLRANPVAEKIRAIKGACALLLGAERQANVAPAAVAADFACEPSGREIHDFLAARDEVLAARVAFDQKCSLDGAVRPSLQAISARIRNSDDSDKEAAARGFNDAKETVDACVVSGKSAGLSEADVQGLLKRSDVFLRTHTMERNRFELAREAFLTLTPDATMAIGVAVAQDAFMFVMKLLSEILRREARSRERERAPLPATLDLVDSDADESEIRVMKTLLRGSRPLYGATSAFDSIASTANLPENVKDNLLGLLHRLVRQGSAYVDRKGGYVIDDQALIESETRLEALLKRKRARAALMGLTHDDARLMLEPQDGAPRPRRGLGALERYLSPRFLNQTAAAEDGEQGA